MNKTKVICEANVWYRLGAKGRISELSNCDLYITNLTIYELISSKKIEIDFDYVHHAFIAIEKYALGNGFILSQNPAQQIILAYNSKYKDNMVELQEKNILNLIRVFSYAQTKDELKYTYNDHIGERKKETEDWCSRVEFFRQKAKKDNINLNSMIDDLLKDLVERYIMANNSEYNLNNFNTSKLHFFKQVFGSFFADLLSDPHEKIRLNDLIDFMNLVYCINDFKYLTLERNSGIGKIIQNYPNYLLPNNDIVIKQLNKLCENDGRKK